MRGRAVVWIGALVWGLWAAPALDAQVVEGTVLDAGSGEPVATARVSLMTADDDRVATTLTDAEGYFLLRSEEGGPHRLEADRLGYGLQHTDVFEVAVEGITEHDFLLVSQAVEVEGIVVEGYPGQILHRADLTGVYARRARSPSVGSNRVLVRGDPQLDSQMKLRDALPPWIPRPHCPHRNDRGERIPLVYYDAWPASRMGHEGTDFILDLPVREVEAVEFYRDRNEVPMALNQDDWGRMEAERVYRDPIRACGLVAVWSRGAPR